MRIQMFTQRKPWYLLLLLPLILLLGGLPVDNQLTAFHSAEELEYFQENNHLLQADTSEFFATSSLCINCHSFDPDGRASVDAQGNDVNVVDDWRASMMANSARDPFWRAKVSHEVLVNPSHKVDIETSCTSCHAPLGHYRAVLTGSELYLISDMLQDNFGIDGVY